MKCFGYLRVSTERQAGDGYTSVADQRAAIQALAAKLGFVVDRWFEDPGASGATAERRPEFMQLVAACQQSPRSRRDPGFVLVLNDSRFGRFGDVEESAYWRVAFRKLGWMVRFCESDDVGDGMARAFVRLASSAQASEYRENIRRNAIRGSRGAASQGFWVSSAPFGYRREVVQPSDRRRILPSGVPKAKDEKIRLAVDPREATIVRAAFARYAAPGETLQSVGRWLLERAPERKWSIPAVRYMLGNLAYLGDVVIGGRMADEERPGMFIKRPTAERWGMPAAHEPIVDPEMFARASEKLAANRAAPRRARSEYALTGILTCSLCGGPYIGGGTSEGQHLYRCAGTVRQPPTCFRGGIVSKHRIEPVVVAAVAAELASPAARRRMVAEVERTLTALENPASDPGHARAEAEANARQARLVAAIADATISRAEAAPLLETIRQDLARIQAAKAHEKFIAARRSSLVAQKSAILADVLNAAARLEAATGPALRAQLGWWCKSLVYDREKKVVRMEIRTAVPVLSASTAGPASSKHTPDVVAREVTLPKVRRGGAS